MADPKIDKSGIALYWCVSIDLHDNVAWIKESIVITSQIQSIKKELRAFHIVALLNGCFSLQLIGALLNKRHQNHRKFLPKSIHNLLNGLLRVASIYFHDG